MGFLRKIGSSKSLREKASKDAYRSPTPPPQLPPLPDHIRRSESKSAQQSNDTQQRTQRRRSRSLWATSDEAKVARTGLQRRDSFCGSTYTTDSSNPSAQPWRSRDAWLALHTPSTPTIVNELTFPCSLDPPTPGWRGRGGGGFFAGTEAMTDADKIKSSKGEDGESIYSLPPRSRSRAATLHSSTGSPTTARTKLAYPTPPLETSANESPMSPTLMPKTGSRRPSHAGSQIEPLPLVSALPPRAVSPAPALPPTPTTPRAPARSNSVTTTARDSTSSGDHGSQSPVTPQQSTQLLQAPPSNFLPSEAKVPWGQASRSASPILFRNDSTSTTHSSIQSPSARSSVLSSRARVQHSPKPPSRALPATPPDSDSGHSNEAHGLPYDRSPRQRHAVDITDEDGGEVIDFTRPRSPPVEQAPGPSPNDMRRSLSSTRRRRSSIQSSYETHESFNSVGSGAFYTPPATDSPSITSAVAQGFFPTAPVPAAVTPVISTLPLPSLSRSVPSSGLVIPPPRSTSRPPSRSASRASRSSHGHSSQGHDMPYTPATSQYPTIAQWRAGSVDSPSPAPAPQSPPLVHTLQPQKTGGSLRSMRRSSHVSTHTHRSMKSAGKAELAVSDGWNPASPGIPDPFAGPWEQPAPYEIGFNPEHQQFAAPLRLPPKTNRLPSLRGNGRLAKAGWI